MLLSSNVNRYDNIPPEVRNGFNTGDIQEKIRQLPAGPDLIWIPALTIRLDLDDLPIPSFHDSKKRTFQKECILGTAWKS